MDSLNALPVLQMYQKMHKLFKLTLSFFIGLAWIPVLFAQQPIDTRLELAEAQRWLTEGKYQKAYDAFHLLAETHQNPLAQFSLGLFHQKGWGMADDQKTACHWFEKAAEGDIPTASHFYAACLQNGTHQPVDYAAAIQWYQKAADLGHIISLCSIAELTMQGKGVPKDPQGALKLCQQAAAAGSIPAQLKMGQFFLQGDKTIHDLHQATVWFNYAAEKGSLEAFHQLGIINLNYLNNHQHALHWFESAASQGFVPAYFPTAQLYFNAPLSEETQMPTADNLAKAYLWLSATHQLSTSKNELRDTTKMLGIVEQIMPASWKNDLDQKISQHLSAFHQH